MTALMVFRVGGRTLAAEAAEIAAVERRPPLTRAPLAPPALAGIGALRGRATPVVELAAALGQADGGGSRLLLLRGEPAAAVAVDAVEGLSEAGPDSPERIDLRAAVAKVFPPSRPVQIVPVAARSRAAHEDELALVAFSLAGQRYAFPIEEVVGVARAPADVFAVPEADPAVAGMAEQDGGVLPILELSDLLGLPRGARAHLIVVRLGGASVGLAVDRLLGVLRIGRGAVSPAPAVLNRGAGEARVSGFARGASGLTAILAAEQLFDAQTRLRLETRAEVPAAPAPAAAPLRGEAFVVFRVGADRYALRASAVASVARKPKRLSRPPRAPAFVAGVAAQGGEAVPILDLRRRFGVEAGAGGVVVFVPTGEAMAGWLVDAVERLAHVARERFEDAPPLGGELGALFPAVVVDDDGPLLVMDAKAALAQTLRDLAAWTPSRPL